MLVSGSGTIFKHSQNLRVPTPVSAFSLLAWDVEANGKEIRTHFSWLAVWTQLSYSAALSSVHHLRSGGSDALFTRVLCVLQWRDHTRYHTENLGHRKHAVGAGSCPSEPLRHIFEPEWQPASCLVSPQGKEFKSPSLSNTGREKSLVGGLTSCGIHGAGKTKQELF